MNSPATGVAVIITLREKILLGQRLNSTRTCWQLPGGFMHMGETPNQAIIRVAQEKTQLDIVEEQAVALTNNVFSPSNHTLSLIFTAKCNEPSKLLLIEKNKCANWHWTTWEELPLPLFLPLQTLVSSGYHPFKPNKPKSHKNKTNNCFIF